MVQVFKCLRYVADDWTDMVVLGIGWVAETWEDWVAEIGVFELIVVIHDCVCEEEEEEGF